MAARFDWSHFDPQSDEALEDPFPAYAWLRENSPVHYAQHSAAWLVTRYDDILRAVRDTKTYSSVGGVGFRVPTDIRARPGFTANDSGASGEHGVARMDHPNHTRIRRLVNTRFLPSQVEQFRTRATRQCDLLLDAAIGKDINFVEVVADHYLPALMGEWMGISAADLDFVGRGAAAASAVASGNYEPQQLARIGEFRAYFREFGKRRYDDLKAGRFERNKPRDLSDVLFSTCSDGSTLSEEEIFANLAILAIGGNGNTSHFMSAMVILFAQQPEILAEIRSNPSSIPAATEELLRYLATTQGMCRVTTREVEIHGIAIPRDSSVLLLYASGNRDERHYDNPDRIILQRFPTGMSSADHLTFASGVHACLGQHLARLLIQVMLDRLANRVNRIELLAPVKRTRNYLVRSLERVQVRMTAL